MPYEPSDRLLSQLPYRSSGARGVQHFKYGQADYQEFRLLLKDLVEQQQPMTVRQAFYRAVVKNYVEKTEKGYGFIQRSLADMRKNRMMPLEWIVDTSRNIRGGQGSNWENVQEFLEDLPDRIPIWYNRDLLADHDFSIQVWLEKEALAGIFEPICEKWDVPLWVGRGYGSITYYNEGAKDLEEKDRPAKIFQFGDCDPSGYDAMRITREYLEWLAPKTVARGVEFKIVAVTQEQIHEMDLPTRPTKGTDTRAGSFGRDRPSVECDAIEPDVLREIIDETLSGCFPPGAIEANEARIRADRVEIRRVVRGWLGDEDGGE